MLDSLTTLFRIQFLLLLAGNIWFLFKTSARAKNFIIKYRMSHLFGVVPLRRYGYFHQANAVIFQWWATNNGLFLKSHQAFLLAGFIASSGNDAKKNWHPVFSLLLVRNHIIMVKSPKNFEKKIFCKYYFIFWVLWFWINQIAARFNRYNLRTKEARNVILGEKYKES